MRLRVPLLCLVLAGFTTVHAQAQTPEEHASHHPGAAPVGDAAPASGTPGKAGMGPPAGAGPPASAGGMMGGGGMGAMMEKMGAPKPKDMYPSLMALPELTAEKRQAVGQQADERMRTGTALMGKALDMLNAGTQAGDYAAMHEAATLLREGVAQLESGVAAKRALAEGRAPRQVALAWFKQEMSLVTPVVSGAPHPDRGLSLFHLFTMGLLVAFAFAMLLLYFFKMRRAAALFARVEPDNGSPPPGSAPPLVGKPGPSGAKPQPSKSGADAAKDDQAPPSPKAS